MRQCITAISARSKSCLMRECKNMFNVDCNKVLSIVGLAGEPGEERLIAEARFAKDQSRPYAEVAFVVDEQFQGLGIAGFLYKMLIRLAKERGIKGLRRTYLPPTRP